MGLLTINKMVEDGVWMPEPEEPGSEGDFKGFEQPATMDEVAEALLNAIGLPTNETRCNAVLDILEGRSSRKGDLGRNKDSTDESEEEDESAPDYVNNGGNDNVSEVNSDTPDEEKKDESPEQVWSRRT